MTAHGFDPTIVHDFLTESGELLEQLEGDLVVLEQRPADPDLLDRIFRALHTIKGSASFLALTELVDVAHAAESALNAARGGAIRIDRAVMDLLLRAVDALKTRFAQLDSGAPLSEADADLVAALTAAAEDADAADSAPHAAADPPHGTLGAEVTPLDLPADKADLIEFLIEDLEQTFAGIDEQFTALADQTDRTHAAGELIELADSVVKNAEFFDFEPMRSLAQTLLNASASLGAAEEHTLAQLLPRLHGVRRLLGEQTAALKDHRLLAWHTDRLVDRIAALSRGEPVAVPLPDGADAQLALRADGVLPREATAHAPPEPDHPGRPSTTPRPARKNHAVEHTIRVEVTRLDTLMNLVGELVLQNNRLAAVSRGVTPALDQDRREQLAAAAADLDRITTDIQHAVMRTRMQPLDRLFGRYPRLIRDLASRTGKRIRLEIEGGRTEVDRSVIEQLGDPLVHLMRNSADHGIEPPDERARAGKPPEGVIRLLAGQEGGQVRIRITDDGRGLDRDRIGALAVKRGLTSENELAAMSDDDVFRFIFNPGFSTAQKVSDISGRGVGMDVVRANIEKLKGSLDLASTPGAGTELSVTIPLTVAVMPALLVAVADEIYAIPLANVLEIVRPRPEQLCTIGEASVMRLRDAVIPLLSGPEILDPPRHDADTPFAVVLTLNNQRLGLLVTRPVGQQEIVVKPLGIAGRRLAGGPICGATVRDDGGVSLIIDIAAMFRIAEQRPAPIAA